MLSLWYGRTTRWQLLLYIRKAFVVFNAIIGIIAILSTIDEEISIASIVNIFNAYLAKFKSYGLNVLQWVLDKVGLVPTPPDNGYPTSPDTGWSKEQIARINELNRQKAELDKALRKLDEYNNFSQQRVWTSWFSWLSGTSDSWIPNWVWYGGLGILGAGVLFIGYTVVTNPYAISDLIAPKRDAYRGGSTSATPDITITDATTGAATSAAEEVTEKVAEGLGEAAASGLFTLFTPLAGLRYFGGAVGGAATSHKINLINTLNPFNWATPDDERLSQLRLYIKQQNAMNKDCNRKLYPYTSDYPFDPWWTRARKAFFGETRAEYESRTEQKEYLWEQYIHEIVDKGKGKAAYVETVSDLGSGQLTPNPFISKWPVDASGVKTPNIATPNGIGPSFHADETIYQVTRLLNAEAKLQGLVGMPVDTVNQNVAHVWSGKEKAVESNVEQTARPSNTAIESDLD